MTIEVGDLVLFQAQPMSVSPPPAITGIVTRVWGARGHLVSLRTTLGGHVYSRLISDVTKVERAAEEIA